MAQIKKTCAVTNGSQTVTLTGDQTDRIKKNSIFLVQNELVPYTVAANATYNSVTNLTTALLTGVYQGATNSAAAGVFSVDFTYPSMIPTIAQGDVGTAAIFTQAMYLIQSLLSGVIAGGAATGVTYNAITDDALSNGTLVYIKSSGNCGLANASAEGKEAVAISLGSYSAGQSAKLAFAGTIVSNLSGLTPGLFYYMSLTPGAAVSAPNAPTSTGNVMLKVGVALSTTQLLFAPETPITL